MGKYFWEGIHIAVPSVCPDFAIALYNADGNLDTSFGIHKIMGFKKDSPYKFNYGAVNT